MSGGALGGARAGAGRNAERVIARLREVGATVAAAESLTGGGLTAALTAVPGASDVVIGGVIGYATRVKAQLLDVDRGLLDRRGAVDPEVAGQMARGVRDVLAATYGVATTGAAGPDPAPGGTETDPVPAGTAYVAVCGPAGVVVRRIAVDGTRDQVRAAVVALALDCLLQTLESSPLGPAGPGHD